MYKNTTLIFLLFFVFSCKTTDLLVQRPQNIKKVLKQRNEDSIQYIISLFDNKDRELSNASIGISQHILIALNDPKNHLYKKETKKRKETYNKKIFNQLQNTFKKNIDFNTKNLILTTLKYIPDKKLKNQFLYKVILNDKNNKLTKTALLSLDINNKDVKDQKVLAKILRYSHGTQFLIVFNYYLDLYPISNQINKSFLKNIIIKNVSDNYIKNICLGRLL